MTPQFLITNNALIGKTEPFTFMPDARTKRYIWSLKVFCFHKSLGCTWTGELRSLEQHLVKNLDNKKGCPFTELQCSNGCGVVMQRRLVERTHEVGLQTKRS